MKKWIIGYYLGLNDELQIMQLMALKEFNETPKYTDEEAKLVIKLIRSKKLPKFEKVHFWGNKTYEEWEKFRINLNTEIKSLFY